MLGPPVCNGPVLGWGSSKQVHELQLTLSTLLGAPPAVS